MMGDIALSKGKRNTTFMTTIFDNSDSVRHKGIERLCRSSLIYRRRSIWWEFRLCILFTIVASGLS